MGRFSKTEGLFSSVSFLPLPTPIFRFLALAPFFARAKHRKSHSSAFVCSQTPRKRLLRRLYIMLLYLFITNKYRGFLHTADVFLYFFCDCYIYIDTHIMSSFPRGFSESTLHYNYYSHLLFETQYRGAIK